MPEPTLPRAQAIADLDFRIAETRKIVGYRQQALELLRSRGANTQPAAVRLTLAERQLQRLERSREVLMEDAPSRRRTPERSAS